MNLIRENSLGYPLESLLKPIDSTTSKEKMPLDNKLTMDFTNSSIFTLKSFPHTLIPTKNKLENYQFTTNFQEIP